MDNKKFKWRVFTSFMMFLSFTIEAITGIILYIVPPGRVANWTNWKLFSLTKSQWQAWHTVFGYLFVGIAVLHIVYNWKPLIHYLKSKLKNKLKHKKEIYATLIVVLIFSIGSIFNIPPISYVYELGENISESWEKKESEPPVPHAERLTVQEIAKYTEMKPEDIFKLFNETGIKVKDKNKTIQEIANDNGLTPSELFNKIKEKTGKDLEKRKTNEEGEVPRRGYGRMSLKVLSIELKTTPEKIIEILKRNGIEATEKDTLRALSEKTDKTPYEIYEIIRNNL